VSGGPTTTGAGDDAARSVELATRLGALGCDALLVLATSARDPDLAPFTGDVHVHGSFLLARRGEEPRLGYLTPMERDEAAATGLALLTPEELDVARWARQGAAEEETLAGVLEQALLLAGVAPGARIALAGHHGAGLVAAVVERLRASEWSFVPGHHLLLELRKRKTAREIATIERAAAGTVEAFRAVARLLAAAESRDGGLWLEGERLRVGRLRREVATVCLAHGLDQPQGNILAAGSGAGVPHTAGADDHLLAPGEALVVDLFPRGGGLFADCTRTFCVGEAPVALRGAHAAVLEALLAAHATAVAGARGWDLQEQTCELLGAHGHPTPLSHPGTTRGYVHGLGHGVGYELHEYPSFRRHAGDEGVLASGDVITLEPGLYEPEQGWGVRLEDLVVLGDDGPRNLTPLPYALDPRAW
jgi:Xaa-Pro aminopeptidase